MSLLWVIQTSSEHFKVSLGIICTTEILFKLNRKGSGVNKSRSDPKMCTASMVPVVSDMVVQHCILLGSMS